MAASLRISKNYKNIQYYQNNSNNEIMLDEASTICLLSIIIHILNIAVAAHRAKILLQLATLAQGLAANAIQDLKTDAASKLRYEMQSTSESFR
jgi:hypothetical protein